MARRTKTSSPRSRKVACDSCGPPWYWRQDATPGRIVYTELANTGLKATCLPAIAFLVGECELRGVDGKSRVGHSTAWNRSVSVKKPMASGLVQPSGGHATTGCGPHSRGSGVDL